jgi:cytochrome c-type biogenesis protein CcsB
LIPFTVLMGIIFVYHGVGVGMRWYISGHAPWSNGYEAVIFIAWIAMIAGFVFSRKNGAVLPATAILAFFILFVTELNLMDPEITPLQPVLKSYWLMIHVAIITGSYGFLGLGAILGFVNMIMYIFRNSSNGKRITSQINEITAVSEMTITIGLYMLTIGTFLGGVWANESWGRYWGWDPKETWALVSVLVYAVILHLRFIPGLSGKFTFNLVSFWGFASIIFTFFGVNFYLVGLHSYAQGEGLAEIPNWIFVTVFVLGLFSVFSFYRLKMYSKSLLN